MAGGLSVRALSIRTLGFLACLASQASHCVRAADEDGGTSSWRCTPIEMLHTRAVSTPAVSENGSWVGPKFPIENANNANVWGALKYIMTETIDKNTGAAGCKRKNGVAYVDFYLFKVCNPNNATWWFSPLKPDGYGGQPVYNYYGFGQYVPFDDGGCHEDDAFCESFHGNQTFPALGSYVGWQNQSADPRAPTAESYWYSLPGSCPEKTRSSNEKTQECMAAEPSGLCAKGVEPDGKNCTYSYEFLGEVVLDELVGITDLGYKDYKAFCEDGKIEFERDPTTFEFVRGLPFWNDSTSVAANRERAEKLIDFFRNDTKNKELPEASELNARNPPCYCNFPQCVTSRCRYDDSQLCVPCSAGQPGCESEPDTKKCKFGLPTAQSLAKVELPAPEENTAEPTTSSTTPTDSPTTPGQDAPDKKSDSRQLTPSSSWSVMLLLFSLSSLALSTFFI